MRRMPLTNGQTFAGYTIIRLLGLGGMGEVYLAQHPRLPRRDALKLLPQDWSADSEYRLRFNREADLASTLWHPHVVGVHDRGEEDGHLWISMDYVDGLDGARLLADRYPAGMPVEQVARIVTAVASALDYAHNQGLLHRDVKPSNIMLTNVDNDGQQRILLTDFGIARDVNEISGLTVTNMAVGTVAYSAPEQLLGENVDGRTDQYSLAATAYHLLTGSFLFLHSNPNVVSNRHINYPPPPLSETRPELAQLDPILAVALAKDPNDRFQRCSDFARALSEEVGSVPGGTSASAPTRPAHVPTRSKRGTVNRLSRLWPLAAVGAVLVAIVLAVAFWGSGQGIPTATAPVHPPTTTRPPPTSTTTTAVTTPAAALPAYPSPNSGCQGSASAHYDYEHPDLGLLRIFLMVNPDVFLKRGCISVATASSAVLPPIPVDIGQKFEFANPATDATGSVFINFSGGGAHDPAMVLVLVPTASGFRTVGGDLLNAELIGPGVNGRYVIRHHSNDCTPSCANGTWTYEDLQWDGSGYVS